MDSGSLDPYALDARWQVIETRLGQIAAAPGLDRELCRAEVDRLFSEQDAIEFVLGFDHPEGVVSRRWSGLAVTGYA
jgi:hypothetical protein